MNPTLFDLPPSPPSLPHNGTKTSREAAQTKHASGTVADNYKEIIKQLIAHPEGMTRHQLVEVTGIELASICGRANELVKSGHLVEIGTRVWNGHGKSKVLRHKAHAGGQQ